MADGNESTGEVDNADELRNEVWDAIADDLNDIVPGEADIQIYESDDDTIEAHICRRVSATNSNLATRV
jgi:hypothetical protein